MITPLGPISVITLLVNVDYISEQTIHSVYVCVKEMCNTSFVLNVIQLIVHNWH